MTLMITIRRRMMELVVMIKVVATIVMIMWKMIMEMY